MKPKFEETPGYVMRHGRRIAVITKKFETPKSKLKLKKPFGAKWV